MKQYSIITLLVALPTFGLAQTQPNKADTLGLFYQLQEVRVTGVKPVPHSIDKVEAKQFLNYNKFNVTESLNLLPGISISYAGARNEGGINLRAFDSRQTAVFYDGIPIYAPYDGNFDLNRFTAFDIEAVSADKRLVSVKYGPNTMAGAVNIISRKPLKPVDISGKVGVGFADGAGVNSYFGSVNAGTRQEHWYAMVGLTIRNGDDFILPKKFESKYNPERTRKRTAYQDAKVSAKVGYTPNATDEYSLNFLTQVANKQIAPNAYAKGPFRDYPIYNKSSIYAKSRTLIAPKTFMNLTGYYDMYYNRMAFYDDDKYLLRNTARFFNSAYDDYSVGAVLNLTTELLKYNILTLSFTDKYDHHVEYLKGIKANPAIGQIERKGEPKQHYKDNTLFVGVEDVITLARPLSVVIGGSYSVRYNILAQEYSKIDGRRDQKEYLWDFPKGADHALGYKAGVIFTPAENHSVSLSAERRSRFASQKERYTSRFGMKKRNPDLRSEYTMAYELSYSGGLKGKLSYEVSAFYDDITDAIYEKKVGLQPNGKDPLVQNSNVGKAEAKGVELGFGYKPFEYLTIGGNYTYLSMRALENFGNENEVSFVNVPRHKIIGYANVSVPQIRTHCYLSSETSMKRLNHDGEYMPNFTLVNAKLSYDIVPQLSLEVSVSNVFDELYYYSNEGYPREGRTFIAGISFRL